MEAVNGLILKILENTVPSVSPLLVIFRADEFYGFLSAVTSDQLYFIASYTSTTYPDAHVKW